MATWWKGKKQDGDTQEYPASLSLSLSIPLCLHLILSPYLYVIFRVRDIKTNFITLITLFTFRQMATSTSYIKQEASASKKDTPSKAEVNNGTQKILDMFESDRIEYTV